MVRKESGKMKGLRAVKVTYSNGRIIGTSMASNLTNTQIKNYFEIGKKFNIGNGAKDLIVSVKKVNIVR